MTALLNLLFVVYVTSQQPGIHVIHAVETAWTGCWWVTYQHKNQSSVRRINPTSCSKIMLFLQKTEQNVLGDVSEPQITRNNSSPFRPFSISLAFPIHSIISPSSSTLPRCVARQCNSSGLACNQEAAGLIPGRFRFTNTGNSFKITKQYNLVLAKRLFSWKENSTWSSGVALALHN